MKLRLDIPAFVGSVLGLIVAIIALAATCGKAPSPSPVVGLSSNNLGCAYVGTYNIQCERASDTQLLASDAAATLTMYGAPPLTISNGEAAEFSALVHATIQGCDGSSNCDCDIRRYFPGTMYGGTFTRGDGVTTDVPVDSYCGFTAAAQLLVSDAGIAGVSVLCGPACYAAGSISSRYMLPYDAGASDASPVDSGGDGGADAGDGGLSPPSSVSGLKAWFVSSLGITLNGSNVSNWADQSGNSNNVASVATIVQPPYVATTPFDYLNFSNTSLGLNNGTLTSALPFDVFMTLRPTGTGAGYMWGPSVNNIAAIYSNGTAFEEYTGSFGNATTFTLNADQLVEVQFNATPALNSVAINNGAPTVGSTGANVPSGAGFDVGNLYATGTGAMGNSAPMRLYEVLIYNRILTSGERTTVSHYESVTYSLGF